jgi:hypothetical protein
MTTLESNFKQSGTNPAEHYLAQLCERTFLSLWSYPNVYRDEFVERQTEGKEICDLLVVFEERVLVFSDKYCLFPEGQELELAWRRWFRRAVARSLKQVLGAERWIRRYPQRIFRDRACRRPIPVLPTIGPRTKFHLIVVAHGVAPACRANLGGSGSLMIQTEQRGSGCPDHPFVIGDVNPGGSFVHVLDDITLPILLTELNTISDLVEYLDRKEAFLRSGPAILAAGEEELVAIYLSKVDPAGRHDFVLPAAPGENFTWVSLDEGFYQDYLASPERQQKFRSDEVSVAWDALIERFSHHAVSDTQYIASPSGLDETGRVANVEGILRFMSREPRLRRRVLSTAIIDALETTPADSRRLRIVAPSQHGDPYYALMIFPWFHEASEAENRRVRLEFLFQTCRLVRLKFSDATDIVGIATESGMGTGRSEDVLYFDGRHWTDADAEGARRFQEETGVGKELSTGRPVTVSEYPEQPRSVRRRIGRNSPCPCGSGRKYKRCHGIHPSQRP